VPVQLALSVTWSLLTSVCTTSAPPSSPPGVWVLLLEQPYASEPTRVVAAAKPMSFFTIMMSCLLKPSYAACSLRPVLFFVRFHDAIEPVDVMPTKPIRKS
jgi:hypothetical protein